MANSRQSGSKNAANTQPPTAPRVGCQGTEAMTDRYEEGRAAGIAEGRAQAFREAAEVARAHYRTGMSTFSIAQAIEAKAKEK